MTLIEAIKSGKHFKRPHFNKYITVPEDSSYCELLHFENMDIVFSPSILDILADDWEVEGEKRELSWEEIERILTQSLHIGYITPSGFSAIKLSLGFK